MDKRTAMCYRRASKSDTAVCPTPLPVFFSLSAQTVRTEVSVQRSDFECRQGAVSPQPLVCLRRRTLRRGAAVTAEAVSAKVSFQARTRVIELFKTLPSGTACIMPSGNHGKV